MDFSYKKNDNQKLFKSLEETPEFGILQPQNYIPLYTCFFTLSTTNHNSIGLNNTWCLHKIIAQETNNIFKCSVKHVNNEKKLTKKVFLKFSPLLDPLKYLFGKYDISDTNLLNLPGYNVLHECNSKVKNINNSAYVDSFFTYLSSKLLHEHGFLHGLDFYGSFLAIKKDFRMNIADDIDYLNDSAFFRKNDKILYELEDYDVDELDSDTRNYKKKLLIEDIEVINDISVLNLSDITDITELDSIVNIDKSSNTSEPELITIDSIPIDSQNKTHSTHSSCSSRSSNTSDGIVDASGIFINESMDINHGSDENTNENSDEEYDEDGKKEEKENGEDESGEDKSGEEESGEEESDDEEDILIAKIKTFPVQVIALEHCENTLDHLMTHGEISNELWDSIVVQILFSLITFKKAFSLTHNDLHTNNVMYVETDKKFLYYKLNHIYYKVPTFGKLFKIIDFGRAIYKFRGQTLCSDSFHPDGDAATQYNCEPYINDKKPRLEPNFSFDLCRLGCALYDYLIDEPKTKIIQIMLDWIIDDKGRNILYKKNGDERYPDFKLYKMIARTVNKHIPIDVLNNSYFDKFIINKKQIKKTNELMDLDTIPNYQG